MCDWWGDKLTQKSLKTLVNFYMFEKLVHKYVIFKKALILGTNQHVNINKNNIGR